MTHLWLGQYNLWMWTTSMRVQTPSDFWGDFSPQMGCCYPTAVNYLWQTCLFGNGAQMWTFEKLIVSELLQAWFKQECRDLPDLAGKTPNPSGQGSGAGAGWYHPDPPTGTSGPFTSLMPWIALRFFIPFLMSHFLPPSFPPHTCSIPDYTCPLCGTPKHCWGHSGLSLEENSVRKCEGKLLPSCLNCWEQGAFESLLHTTMLCHCPLACLWKLGLWNRWARTSYGGIHPLMPAFRRPKKENLEFKASQGHTARPCPKNKEQGMSSTLGNIVTTTVASSLC